MEDRLKNIVFSKNAVEFVTVAVQYCGYLENLDEEEALVTDKLTKLLPLLYLKATMLPESEMQDEADPEETVTEDVYNFILSRVYDIYGQNDTYLEVFLQDMKYSETPISASISEDVTDIYQDLKNFITIYERGVVEYANDALYICNENFKAYWGQKLVNVLRALHSLKYSGENDSFDDDFNNIDEAW
ncbi:DUF5063 domain-containing protein [Dysgonomonas sp. 216]|uniref:DUF5063 domain-containing protein n=1 Tax=Dysgonomonas sp. 216 TaxID=2302934 RepID=UPI0013D41472|nr:DUF5063 domain-containing protein [Dysgonomonas sp. 216]NDW19202.1 DUF5063 domain-containing protein [Dysgonomonas sp. 216]